MQLRRTIASRWNNLLPHLPHRSSHILRRWFSSSHPHSCSEENATILFFLSSYGHNTSSYFSWKQWRSKLNPVWRELSEFSVSMIFFSSTPSFTRFICILELIGKLDDGFSHPLIIKCKTDIPFFQDIKEKFDNKNTGEQSLELTQGWWENLSNAQAALYIFMRCSIVKEGNNLNIEIYKESRQWKIITLGHVSEGDLLCRVSIKFDNLWRYLVSESQKETKCELILCLDRLQHAERYLSEICSGIKEYSVGISALDHRWGTHLIATNV